MARSENKNQKVLRELIDTLNMCQAKEHFKALVYNSFPSYFYVLIFRIKTISKFKSIKSLKRLIFNIRIIV
jgi:hypothetical protein